MGHWLLNGNVQRLVVVVTGVDSGETLERWQFNVRVEDRGDNPIEGSGGGDVGEKNKGNDAENMGEGKENKSAGGQGGGSKNAGKSLKEIHNEIQAIIRQITASVSCIVLFFLKTHSIF
jgi:HORMA domain.